MSVKNQVIINTMQTYYDFHHNELHEGDKVIFVSNNMLTTGVVSKLYGNCLVVLSDTGHSQDFGYCDTRNIIKLPT